MNLPVVYTGRDFDFDRFEYFKLIRGKRILAYLFDLVLVSSFSFGMSFLLLVFSFGTLWFLMPFVFTLTALGYHSLLIGSPASATLGMRFFNIKVIRQDGGRLDYVQAFIQVLLFYASVSFLTPAILLVSLFNRQGRTLHEFLSGTLTINREGEEINGRTA